MKRHCCLLAELPETRPASRSGDESVTLAGHRPAGDCPSWASLRGRFQRKSEVFSSKPAFLETEVRIRALFHRYPSGLPPCLDGIAEVPRFFGERALAERQSASAQRSLAPIDGTQHQREVLRGSVELG